VPEEITWKEFKSDILPISFNYPNIWGDVQEKQSDLSEPPLFEASGYSLGYTELYKLQDYMRWSSGTGQTSSYTPGRMSYYMDFKGYNNKPKGVYFKMGTQVFNCNDSQFDISGNTPTNEAYIEINLPDNNVANGVRLFIPIFSPYTRVQNITGIKPNCDFVNETKVDSRSVGAISTTINSVLPKYDKETQQNLKIFLGILKSVEVE
jgi:hypothetical protein